MSQTHCYSGPHSWVLESCRACWGPHSWSWRAAGCAGVLTPGPGEPQGVPCSSFVFDQELRPSTPCCRLSEKPGVRTQSHPVYSLGQEWGSQLAPCGSPGPGVRTPAHPAALQDQEWGPQHALRLSRTRSEDPSTPWGSPGPGVRTPAHPEALQAQEWGPQHPLRLSRTRSEDPSTPCGSPGPGVLNIVKPLDGFF